MRNLLWRRDSKQGCQNWFKQSFLMMRKDQQFSATGLAINLVPKSCWWILILLSKVSFLILFFRALAIVRATDLILINCKKKSWNLIEVEFKTSWRAAAKKNRNSKVDQKNRSFFFKDQSNSLLSVSNVILVEGLTFPGECKKTSSSNNNNGSFKTIATWEEITSSRLTLTGNLSFFLFCILSSFTKSGTFFSLTSN